MRKRVIIAGLAGGMVMFLWGAVSHMLLGLGDAGLSQLKSQEEPVLGALRQSIKEPGLYFYPGFMTDHPSQAEQQAWMEKYRRGPSGLLLYHPSGEEPMSAKQFTVQVAGDFALGLLAAALLAGSGCWQRTFPSRVSFVSLVGLIPFLTINLPYWNWYGFPTTFTLAQLADQFLGFIFIGVVVGAILKPKSEPIPPVGAVEPSHALAVGSP